MTDQDRIFYVQKNMEKIEKDIECEPAGNQETDCSAGNDRLHNAKVVCDAYDFIEKNVFSDITINDVASSVEYSVDHLTKLFKNVKGITLAHLIRDKRLEHSKKILLETEKRVTEIARDLHFTDSNYFIKCFKKEFGVTPSQYRKDTTSK